MEDREKPEDNVQKMGPVENLEVKNLVSPLNLAKSLLHCKPIKITAIYSLALLVQLL